MIQANRPMKVSDEARKAAASYVAVSFGPKYYEAVMSQRGFPDLVQAFARFEAETRKDERERCADAVLSGIGYNWQQIARAIRSLSDDGEGG